MSSTDDERYQCVGVCMSDPDSGYCMGCGRPPLGGPEVNVELVPAPPPETHPETDQPA